MEKDRTIPAGVSAIQIDASRIEYAPIDLALAYASIAPLVTEAYAYFKSGKRNEAEEAIEKARAKIEMATMFEGMIVSPEHSENHDGSFDETVSTKVKLLPGGLELIEFKDSRLNPCSIQVSAATGEFLWIGVDEHRMHLSKEQVEGMVGSLEVWLEKGTFQQPKE